MPRRFRLAFALALLVAFALICTLAAPRPALAAPGSKAKPGATASVAPSAAPAPAGSEDEGEEDDGPPLPWKVGPQKIDAGHGVVIDLPAGRRFLGLPDAADVMKKMGNLYTDDLLGIAISDADQVDYLVSFRYDEEGFVKDDEKLDSSELLESIRSGEAEYNEERKKAGFPPIHAEGWFEEPAYDKPAHKLTWALKVSASDGSSINLSTRVLGRRGYVAVTLLADPEKVAAYRDDGKAWVTATSFSSGNAYGDFNPSTDKVAEYGLAGLIVAGVGVGVLKAAKVGLLAAFWKPILAFVIAAKKAVILAIAAIAAFYRKLFTGRSSRKAEAPKA